MDDDRTFPTMIIPNGTEITVNDRGQLAIKTPGNLVIQNPGTYSVIECTKGSIRIDANVKVETVSVQVADTCCVAGNLTAWQVRAKRVVLEKGSQAFVMLLQTDNLELDKQARLVGNFGTEQELYLMLSRFNNQLRELPQALSPGDMPAAEIPATTESARNLRGATVSATTTEAPPLTGTPTVAAPPPAPGPLATDDEPARQEESDVVALMRVMLQRELLRNETPGVGRDDLSALLAVLRPGQLASIEEPYRRARSHAGALSLEIRGAFERFDRFLAIRRPWAGAH